MATTIVPGTAIQKIVDVSIKDAKTFSEKVFFLELWPIEKATEKTIEVKDEGENSAGAFEPIQFKFDKNNNFIYTSRDINQKSDIRRYCFGIFYIRIIGRRSYPNR